MGVWGKTNSDNYYHLNTDIKRKCRASETDQSSNADVTSPATNTTTTTSPSPRPTDSVLRGVFVAFNYDSKTISKLNQ